MKLFFTLTLSIVCLIGCSFSKVPSKSERLTPELYRLQLLNKLRSLSDQSPTEISKTLENVSVNDINTSWEDGNNLLNYIVRYGSSEHLDILLKKGLSPFLPLSLDFEYDSRLKAQVANQHGSITVHAPEVDLHAGSDKISVLMNEYERIVAELYQYITAGEKEKAVRLFHYSRATCGPVVNGLLLHFQFENGQSLGAVTNFLQEVDCGLRDISMKDKQFLWKAELQRQFALKFEKIELLKALRDNEEMPYLNSVKSSVYMFGLKTIIEASRGCHFIEEQNLHNVSLCTPSVDEKTLDTIVFDELHFSKNQFFEKVFNLPGSKYIDLMGGYSSNAMYAAGNGFERMYYATKAGDNLNCPDDAKGDASIAQGVFRLFNGLDFDSAVCEIVTNESSAEE